MAENLEIIASVKIDFSKFKNDIEGAKRYLGTLQAEYAKVVDVFGEGSKEAKEAGEAVRQMTEYLKGAGAAGEGIDQPVKSLKAQLREANAELQLAVDKFGIGSKEAGEAAAKVAKLKDTIGDAKTLTDAFNPDAKFKGLANAVQGAVGAFTALQGAQALFGNQSKQVQETLVKLQGALALSQGVNSVLEAKDSFIALGNQIKSASIFQQGFNLATRAATAIQSAFGVAVNTTSTSFKVLKGAIVSTGIGALVVALGFVVEKIMAWTDSTKDQEEAQKKLNDQLEKSNDLLEQELQGIDYSTKLKIANAKKLGASEEELTKITEDQNDKRLAALRKADADALRISDEAQKNDKISAEEKKKLLDKTIETNRAVLREIERQGVQSAEKQAADAEKAREKEADAVAKANEKRKAAREKALQDEKQRQEQRAAFIESTEKLIEDNRLAALEDGIFKQQALADRAFQQELDKLIELKNKKVINEKDYQARRAELETQLALNIKKIIDDNAKKEAENRKKAADEIAKLEFDAKLRGITDNEEKLRLQRQAAFDKEKKDLDNQLKNKEITQDEYDKILRLKQQNLEADLTKIKEDGALARFNKDLELLEKQIANNQFQYDLQLEAINKEEQLLNDAKARGILSEEEYNKKLKDLSNKRLNVQLAEKEARAKITAQIADTALAGVKLLSSIFEKSKGLQIAGIITEQAGAIAKIITNTQAANAAAVAKYALIPGGQALSAQEITFNKINAGIGIASAVAAAVKGIQQIKSANASGGGASSAGGGGETGGGAAAAAPIAAQQETTALPQEQINQLASANATVRAYVVESDVTGNQERITRLNRAARIS